MENHPLIREIQLGKTIAELIEEHNLDQLSAGFQRQTLNGTRSELDLESIIREIVRIDNKRLRFAVRETWHSCVLFPLNGKSDLTIDYWDYDREDSSLEVYEDCDLLNELVEKLYGFERKKPKAKLTNEQFVDQRGKVCPYCESSKTTLLEDVTFKDSSIFGCESCGETWRRRHKTIIKVTGFSGT